MVFQHSRPLNRQTVLENILVALLPDSLFMLFPDKALTERAKWIAERVGLGAVMRSQRGLWLFLVPSFGLMTLVLLWPLGYAAYLSTFDYYLGSREMRFVGLANYAQLLGEARLWQSLWTTIVIALGSVGVEFALGFMLAFALYRLTFSVRVFMILLFLPHIITPVVATLFLKWILTSNWGLIDATLMTFNIGPPDWLGDPIWAKICVILADAWIFTPFVMTRRSKFIRASPYIRI